MWKIITLWQLQHKALRQRIQSQNNKQKASLMVDKWEIITWWQFLLEAFRQRINSWIDKQKASLMFDKREIITIWQLQHNAYCKSRLFGKGPHLESSNKRWGWCLLSEKLSLGANATWGFSAEYLTRNRKTKGKQFQPDISAILAAIMTCPFFAQPHF